MSGSHPVLWALSLVQTAEFNRKKVTTLLSSPIKAHSMIPVWYSFISYISAVSQKLLPGISHNMCCNTSTHTSLISGNCLPRGATYSIFFCFKGRWEETATQKVSLCSWSYFISMKSTICNFQVISQVIKHNEAISICKIPYRFLKNLCC